MRKPARRTVLAVGLGGLVAALVAAGLQLGVPAATPPPGVTLTDLRGVDDLKARFNSDRGVPRLLLVLSPT